MSILVIGQSNAVNITSSVDFIPSGLVSNYNFYDGRVYEATDPLLGCQNAGGDVAGSPGGNFATRLGHKMVEAGFPSVVLTNCAIGSTSIGMWAPGGVLQHRVRYVIRSMQQAGVPPDIIVLMLGESDNLAGTTSVNMRNGIRSLVDLCRVNGASCPILVSRTSYINATVSAAVRQGQLDAVDENLKIYAGPDTDSLTAGFRLPDKTHFNTAGIEAVADQWLEAIVSLPAQ